MTRFRLFYMAFDAMEDFRETGYEINQMLTLSRQSLIIFFEPYTNWDGVEIHKMEIYSKGSSPMQCENDEMIHPV